MASVMNFDVRALRRRPVFRACPVEMLHNVRNRRASRRLPMHHRWTGTYEELAEKQEESDPQLQEKVKRLRDAEDVLDEFMLHLASYWKDAYGLFGHTKSMRSSLNYSQDARC